MSAWRHCIWTLTTRFAILVTNPGGDRCGRSKPNGTGLSEECPGGCMFRHCELPVIVMLCGMLVSAEVGAQVTIRDVARDLHNRDQCGDDGNITLDDRHSGTWRVTVRSHAELDINQLTRLAALRAMEEAQAEGYAFVHITRLAKVGDPVIRPHVRDCVGRSNCDERFAPSTASAYRFSCRLVDFEYFSEDAQNTPDGAVRVAEWLPRLREEFPNGYPGPEAEGD